jgi:hypothetical protein
VVQGRHSWEVVKRRIRLLKGGVCLLGKHGQDLRSLVVIRFNHIIVFGGQTLVGPVMDGLKRCRTDDRLIVGYHLSDWDKLCILKQLFLLILFHRAIEQRRRMVVALDVR